MEQNNTSFQVKSTAKLRDLYEDYKSGNARGAGGLRYYQYLAKTVMTDPEWGIGAPGNSRGILIFHEMGLGKTRLAVSIAQALGSKNRQPIILAPNSLKSNFKKTQKVMEKFKRKPKEGEKPLPKIEYEFPSLDAPNSAKQIESIKNGLNNKLLIVDEAHNLFRSIINGASNAKKIYDLIMEATNLRIVFLSGTPIVKSPFEMVPCVNMLCGNERLPASYEAFEDLFMVPGGVNPLNRNLLRNRLMGLVSHVSSSTPIAPEQIEDDMKKPKDDGWFPEELPLITHEVEMSKPQYENYVLARSREAGENEGKLSTGKVPRNKIRNEPMTLPMSSRKSSSTYNVKSRSLCNFNVAHDETRSTEDLPDSAFTKEASPKLTIISDHADNAKGPILVYSQFIDHGLAALSRYLKLRGYSDISPEDMKTDPCNWKPKKRYAIISGSIKLDTREKIRLAMNCKENVDGSLIKVIMVSKSGAEGLDLNHLRETHQLEYYWDHMRFLQVKSRAVCQGSHDMLPVEERTVQPYIYVALKNNEVWEGMRKADREETTIDEQLREKSLKSFKTVDDFTNIYKEVCIECEAYGYKNCHTCAPSNMKIMTGDAQHDASVKNPCQTKVLEKVRARKLVVDGVVFYEKNKEFFMSDPETKAFILVNAKNPAMAKLRRMCS